MVEKKKTKSCKTLEAQFWSDDVKIDKDSPLTKLVDKLWNSDGDYMPTEDEKKQFDKEMQEYHEIKEKSTQK